MDRSFETTPFEVVEVYSAAKTSTLLSALIPASFNLLKSSRSSVSVVVEMYLIGLDSDRTSATAGCKGCQGIGSHWFVELCPAATFHLLSILSQSSVD